MLTIGECAPRGPPRNVSSSAQAGRTHGCIFGPLGVMLYWVDQENLGKVSVAGGSPAYITTGLPSSPFLPSARSNDRAPLIRTLPERPPLALVLVHDVDWFARAQG